MTEYKKKSLVYDHLDGTADEWIGFYLEEQNGETGDAVVEQLSERYGDFASNRCGSCKGWNTKKGQQVSVRIG